MKTRAKFEVVKASELGHSGKRQEILGIKKHVPANTADPDDGSVVRYDRTEHEATGVPIREITLSAVYGGSQSSAEDQSFATATPSGTITFYLNNPALADEFKPGMAYYVDFTPVGE
jgi:hypothetical protein